MQEEKIPESSASGSEGSANGHEDDSSKQQSQTPESVSWDDYARMRADMHKHKEEAKLLKAEKEAFESKRLRETNDFKTLAEQLETEKKALEERFDRFKETTVHSQRIAAVREEAVKKGLRPEAANDLDLLSLEDDVEVEATSSGRFLVRGQDSFVKRLLEQKPHWFQKQSVGKVNGGGGSAPPEPSKITAAQVLAAERAYRQDRQDASKKEAYVNLIKRYDEQKQNRS